MGEEKGRTAICVDTVEAISDANNEPTLISPMEANNKKALASLVLEVVKTFSFRPVQKGQSVKPHPLREHLENEYATCTILVLPLYQTWARRGIYSINYSKSHVLVSILQLHTSLHAIQSQTHD